MRFQLLDWFKKMMRGYSEADTWNLDVTISKFILPRLKYFKEVTQTYPSDISEHEWACILCKMIYAFEKIAKRFDSADNYDYKKEEEIKIQEGLMLFAKYFSSLWW